MKRSEYKQYLAEQEELKQQQVEQEYEASYPKNFERLMGIRADAEKLVDAFNALQMLDATESSYGQFNLESGKDKWIVLLQRDNDPQGYLNLEIIEKQDNKNYSRQTLNISPNNGGRAFAKMHYDNDKNSSRQTSITHEHLGRSPERVGSSFGDIQNRWSWMYKDFEDMARVLHIDLETLIAASKHENATELVAEIEQEGRDLIADNYQINRTSKARKHVEGLLEIVAVRIVEDIASGEFTIGDDIINPSDTYVHGLHEGNEKALNRMFKRGDKEAVMQAMREYNFNGGVGNKGPYTFEWDESNEVSKVVESANQGEKEIEKLYLALNGALCNNFRVGAALTQMQKFLHWEPSKWQASSDNHTEVQFEASEYYGDRLNAKGEMGRREYMRINVGDDVSIDHVVEK